MERLAGEVKKLVLGCIKWRYLIALVVFVFCVVCKVHGSSINQYNMMFDGYESYEADSIILGESRAVRSDEWIVHTPYYMSQYYNNYDKSSNMMSLEGQDMIVGYNAPVANITMIAKPFTWGYLLFGNEYGLSWYWCSKMILLILVSFELCLIVTRGNKKVSLLGMLMIAFAPAVQWWFVPHMVDVFFWVMAVLVLAYRFLMSTGKLRLLWMCLLPMAVITFVLALFPSLQVATGLAFGALFVALMVRDRKEITFKKRDIWMVALMMVIVMVILGYTLWTSREAILALFHTVYPGSRVSLGGEYGMDVLFTDLTSLALPYKEITYSNSSEISTFIQFAPVFLMLYPVIWKKMKRDKNIIVGNVLLVCVIVMGVFMMVGFPELLAKITMFSYINRMKIAYGLVATIFTVWGIDMIWKKNIFIWKEILIIAVIYGFSYICFMDDNQIGYVGRKWLFVIIVMMMVLVVLMLSRKKMAFLIGMSIVMIMSGGMVNPVARGITALTEHPLEKKIREITNEEPEAYWLAINNNLLASVGVVNGARMLDMVNFYPDYEKWNIIDPDGRYETVYNRYAHMIVTLDKNESTLELGLTQDIFMAKISCEDVLKWPVKYLLVNGEMKACTGDFKRIYSDTEGDYYIYKRISK